ncbi:hypothetical protein VKT23_010226 [Stygiomarasmius scandens]|uniref:Uncharacterized protein n=1 Tax=Marasmiellus scandens TaxID=2682957 RepID=A0ABR1JH44_9AGAR
MDATKPKGFPTASPINIEDEEYDLTRTTRSLRERLGVFLGNRLNIWARKADADATEGPRTKDPKFALELSNSRGTIPSLNPSFPPTLYLTVKTSNTLIPLPFFTTKNFARLVTENLQCIGPSRDLHIRIR